MKIISGTSFVEGEENDKSHIKAIDRIEISKEIEIMLKEHEIELNCKVYNTQKFLFEMSRGVLASMSLAFD